MARRDAQEVLDDALCSDPPGGRLAARYLWIQIGVYGRPLRRFSRPGNGSATDPLIWMVETGFPAGCSKVV